MKGWGRPPVQIVLIPKLSLDRTFPNADNGRREKVGDKSGRAALGAAWGRVGTERPARPAGSGYSYQEVRQLWVSRILL